jgi:hypothetical protein
MLHFLAFCDPRVCLTARESESLVRNGETKCMATNTASGVGYVSRLSTENDTFRRSRRYDLPGNRAPLVVVSLKILPTFEWAREYVPRL